MPSHIPAPSGLNKRSWELALIEASELSKRHGVDYHVVHDKRLRKYRAEVKPKQRKHPRVA